MWNRLTEYVRGSYGELKKVSWPTKDEVTGSTIIVIIFIIILSLILGLIDILVTNVVQMVLGAPNIFNDFINWLFKLFS